MLTNRGRWIVLLSLTGAILGLLRNSELGAFVSLALLVWVTVEWALFRWRVNVVLTGVRVRRTINGSKDPQTLWVGRPARVRVRITSSAWGSVPFVELRDFLPAGVEADGNAHIRQTAIRGAGTSLDYSLIPVAAGDYSLRGLCLRVCDLQGLFYAQRFLPAPQQVRVLPSYSRADAPPRQTKRHNALLPPGMHRFLRAGAGPELLELREYQPGDPPKSIAWKVSARKNSLMTRQYESEVPARATLFVDCSAATRIGAPGRRATDTIVSTAATLAHTLMLERDPVALVRYDETQTRVLRHGSGERHLFRMLDALAQHQLDHDTVPVAYSAQLLDQTWTTCEDLYPELLDDRVNKIPFTWLPIIPERRRIFRRRLRLANVLAALFDLPGDASLRLTNDDAVMARWCCRLLRQAGVRWNERLFNGRGENLLATPGRIRTAAESIVKSVAVARDNEVFVLVADLLDHAGRPGRLLDALRTARSRHHRVVVICPWPAAPEEFSQKPMPADINELARKAEEARLAAAAEALRSDFRRLGIPFAMAPDHKAIRLVLAEAGLVRNGRTRTGVGV